MNSKILAGLLIVCVIPAQADWLDWRGPTANGHSDAIGLPLHWSETEHVKWKVPVRDFGHSTPVVKGNQIWLTTATKDGSALYALCFDLETGDTIHDIEVFQPAMSQRIHPVNTYATPSIALEDNRAYVHFGTFGTACLDTRTGEVLWKNTDLHCDHMQGPASSPILFEDLLILDLEGVDVQFMVALDKDTGKLVWKEDRAPELFQNIKPLFLLKSYITPIIEEVDGQPQLIANASQLVSGHDPRTGKEIWRVVYGGDSSISRTVSGHGMFFVNTGGPPGGTWLWAVRQGGTGDVTDSHVAWTIEDNVPLETSPVLVDDLLYMMSDTGTLTCVEAKTGEIVWTVRLRGRFSASLLYVEGRIYISSKQGKTVIIKPGRIFDVVGENQLDGGFWASPAVVGKSLIMRSKTHLYRIEN